MAALWGEETFSEFGCLVKVEVAESSRWNGPGGLTGMRRAVRVRSAFEGSKRLLGSGRH
jgi:hypothetical protein